MIIQIKVKTNARHEAVVEVAPGQYQVAVNAPPRDGEANEAIIALIAKHFKVSKSQVVIKSGGRSKQKRVEIS